MEKTQNRSQPKRPAIEWAFGAISAVFVAALVAFLGVQALFGENRPPDLRLTIERVDQAEDTTIVTVGVANHGDQAAATVTILASLGGPSDTVLQKQIEFDYVAAHASRRGSFSFPGRVSLDELDLAVGGYTEP